MPANRSADSTRRIHSLQPSSQLVKKVDQPNQLKGIDPNITGNKVISKPNQRTTIDPSETRPYIRIVNTK